MTNNEKFTHLIRFYKKLSQQNEEYVHKIESSLFNVFGKNIELFSKVIFQGMHSMLYKLSIPMIQQLIQLLTISNFDVFVLYFVVKMIVYC